MSNHNEVSNPVGNAAPYTRNGANGAIIRRDPGYVFLPLRDIQAVAEQLADILTDYKSNGGIRTDDGIKLRPDNGITSIVEPMRWSDIKGEERTDGVKLARGRNFLFIPAHAVLETADALVDYAEGR